MLMNKPLYFKGLNGLRAIAAIIVLISHTFVFFNVPEKFLNFELNQKTGDFGVTIFFTLSGFLITFLLLQEKKNGKINIRKFYIRRLLRIWPLYFVYLIIALSVLIFANKLTNTNTLWSYFIFFVNSPFYASTSILAIGHLWSISIEEQFYLFWPWLIKFNVKSIYIFIITWITAKAFYYYCNINIAGLDTFFAMTRFECMCIGGLTASFYYAKNPFFVKVCVNYNVQKFTWLIIGLLFIIPLQIGFVDHIILLIFISVIIIAQIASKDLFFNLENKFLNFTGKVSYGIYMFNPLVILSTKKLFLLLPITGLAFFIIVVLIELAITIFIAWLSYTYFEKKILNFKSHFAS